MAEEALIRVENMYKYFGPTIALNGFSFSVPYGEVKGLIGENGSGKSTVSSIIAGAQSATRGKMYLDGKSYSPKSMLEAQKNGIAMIVQEAGTVSGITVAENIFAGKEKLFSRYGFVNKGKLYREAGKALEKVGIKDITPDMQIDRLNMEERKLVELARALYDDPKLLIIDETTTALAEKGRQILYRIVQQLRADNRSVLFISHDIDELMEVCDSLVVLRDGNYIGELDKPEFEPGLIRKMLVGREVTDNYYRNDQECTYEDTVLLKADHITAGFTLKKVSLELHKGEILGIGGLADSGMHDLGKALFGIEKVWNGSVTMPQKGIRIDSPLQAIYNQMGYVSKDRDTEALILDAPIRDNIALAGYHVIERNRLILSREVKSYVSRQIDSLQIKCNHMNEYVSSLSGGNKQKVSFARWMGNDTQVLILDCPTRGVDVGVKASMYQLMEEMKQQGKAILMISEELPELIGMSDRMLIMKNGEFTAEFRRGGKVTETDLIDYMI